MAGHPEHVNVWLALFEILYLERTAAEFSELARRYRDARDTATDEHWPMIVRLGYKLDPENPLFSTGGPGTDEPQPNWLNSELDMMGDALAIELHMQMLARQTPSKPADSNSITYEP
jgi:hypothetical protein